MKSLNYILASAFAAALTLGFTSCKDTETYTLAEKLSNAQVYFPGLETSKVFSVTNDDNSVTFDLARRNTTDALTVPLTITGNEKGLLTIPTSASFAANQSNTTLTVNFDGQTLDYDDKQVFDVKIGDESYTTPYGLDHKGFTVYVPAPWVTIGTATYREDIFPGMFGNDVYEYEVDIQENQLTPGFYRLVNPYDDKYPDNAEGDWDTSQDYYLEIHAENPDRVYFNTQSTGVNWNYGEIYISSMAGYYLENGKTEDEVAEKGYFGTLKDNIITFPVKSLAMFMGEYSSYGNTNGMFRIALPGAVLGDYSIGVSYGGKYTNANDDAIGVYAQVDSIGEDVATVKYALAKGTYADGVIAGVKDGSIEAVEATPKQTSVQIPYGSVMVDGLYTIVAVTYDKNGNAQNTSTSLFKYTGEKWNSYSVGDFTYTMFFGDEDEPVVDEGLELYQSALDSNRYKIAHWGYDTDFIFTYNPETGEVMADDQETGLVHPTYGMIYVDDLVDYTGTTQYGKSSYANGTFTFFLIYYCSEGEFVYGPETFTLKSASSVNAKAPKAKAKKATKASKKASAAKHRTVTSNMKQVNKREIKSAKQLFL